MTDLLSSDIRKTIKPCPYCGGSDLDYGITDEYDGAFWEEFRISCNFCDISGPSAGNISWGRGTDYETSDGRILWYEDEYDKETERLRYEAERNSLQKAIQLWNGSIKKA